MPGRADEIAEVLAALADAVAAELAEQGWVRRHLDDVALLSLTRETSHRVLATAALLRTDFRWPDAWPVELKVGIGVGYEPALNLMPLLTLRPSAALLTDHRRNLADTPKLVVNADAIAAATEQAVTMISTRAMGYAEQFADADAIDAALVVALESDVRPGKVDDETSDERPADDTSSGDTSSGVKSDALSDEDEVHWRRRRNILLVERRLLLLAATGRLADARALLADYSSMSDDDGDPRFVRRLTRWLDAGGPPAPPVEETLAKLPRNPRTPRPSLAATRAKSKRRRAVSDAVRKRSRGKSIAEISADLAAESARQGQDFSTGDLAVGAYLLHQHRQPLGRLRTTVTAVRFLGTAVTTIVHALKGRSVETPEWATAPPRASYEMTTSEHRTTIRLDPDARHWLGTVWTQLPSSVAPLASVTVWFTAVDGELVAHIGERRVGYVAPENAELFEATMRAGEMFDEDPVARAILTVIPESDTVILEVPTPQSLPPAT